MAFVNHVSFAISWHRIPRKPVLLGAFVSIFIFISYKLFLSIVQRCFNWKRRKYPTRNNAILIYYASKITCMNEYNKKSWRKQKKKRKKHLMAKIHIDPKDWRDHVQRKLSNALTMARGSRVHTSRLDTCRSLSVCADHFLRMIHRVR